ncbi:MAG: LysM peptidoglycan-binding domain-containing protein [Planctomycetota bacterium]|nr:MAG: LysM peptidoglycan-binding domain-containing protein [Planctomycetota bacterium]
MTLPSQSPRSHSPISAGARNAQGMRSLFIAVAAIGLGGAAAGWFLTHKSESPEVKTETAAITDPLNTDGAAATSASNTTTIADSNVVTNGTSTSTATPAAPLGTSTTTAVTTAQSAVTGAASAGIAGTPGTPATTPAATLGNASQRIQQANAMISSDPIRARAELTRLLDSNALSATERAQAYAGINGLGTALFFSPKIVPGDIASQSYVVKKGDSLARIASREKLGVDWRFIQRINGMASEKALRADMHLKLAHGPFDGEVVKADYRFNVYTGTGSERVMVASFPCGVGTNDSTPVGTFKVRAGSKLIDPEWCNPRTGEKFKSNDPKNPIGERWIGLQGTTPDTAKFTGYGIHGTVDPQSIGKQMSMGCVRLGDAEVQVVYELIGESSTIVIR